MEIIITNKWNSYLDYFDISNKDIYYYEEYVKLYETEEGTALCVVCKDDDKILLFPYIRKKIKEYYDFETAYGYGGPISNIEDNVWIDRAFNNVVNYLKEEKYLCGFVRFHTLLNNVNLCHRWMKTIYDRETIAIDTSKTECEIWNNQIISKNRNMIRKAEKNDLCYKAEYDFESIGEFIVLYNETMKRLGADEFYYFDKRYFDSFIKNFKNKAFLGTVRKEGKLICAAIFMYSGIFGHYHLEGSDHNFSNLAANNFLLWKTALEMQKLGVKEFHLGGGYNSEPDNSLYKFKRAFSNNIKEFYIGKWILNEEKYNEFRDEWIKNNPEKVDKFGAFLLCYRY